MLDEMPPGGTGHPVMTAGRTLKKQNGHLRHGGQRRKLAVLALTLLLIASPWLVVQGWIVAAAHDPEHTTMPNCPDPTANCASVLSAKPSFEWMPDLTTVIQANVSEVWDAWVEWSEDNGLRKG